MFFVQQPLAYSRYNKLIWLPFDRMFSPRDKGKRPLIQQVAGFIASAMEQANLSLDDLLNSFRQIRAAQYTNGDGSVGNGNNDLQSPIITGKDGLDMFDDALQGIVRHATGCYADANARHGTCPSFIICAGTRLSVWLSV